MVAEIEQGFSGKRTAEIVGITYRQLDYWARTDLVRPSLQTAKGSGSRRRYSYRDLLELKVIKNLLDAGIKLESVREVFSYLRENLGEDVASANLVISGTLRSTWIDTTMQPRDSCMGTRVMSTPSAITRPERFPGQVRRRPWREHLSW